MSKEKWIWMPHAGHFICGKDCRFRLNTYVNGYIVSTVGELWPDSTVREIYAQSRGVVIKGIGDEWDSNYFKQFGYEEVGLDRLYETMVFKAKVNTENPICCPYRMDTPAIELDFMAYNDATQAYKGHLEMCEKWDSNDGSVSA